MASLRNFVNLKLGALVQRDLSPDELRAAIERSAFAGHADELVAQLRRSLRVRVDQGARGGSRFGGLPLVPAGFAWPHWDARAHFENRRRYAQRCKQEYRTPFWDEELRALDAVLADDTRRPLVFLAQFELASLPRHAALPPLPDHGVLYFFADLVNGAPGSYPSSRGGWQAIWVPEAGELREAVLPPYPVSAGEEDFASWTCELSTARSYSGPKR